MSRLDFLVPFAFAIMVLALLAANAILRTWTSRTGNFSASCGLHGRPLPS